MSRVAVIGAGRSAAGRDGRVPPEHDDRLRRSATMEVAAIFEEPVRGAQALGVAVPRMALLAAQMRSPDGAPRD